MDKSLLSDVLKMLIVIVPFAIRELYTMHVSSRFELQFATNKIKLLRNVIIYGILFIAYVIILLTNFDIAGRIASLHYNNEVFIAIIILLVMVSVFIRNKSSKSKRLVHIIEANIDSDNSNFRKKLANNVTHISLLISLRTILFFIILQEGFNIKSLSAFSLEGIKYINLYEYIYNPNNLIFIYLTLLTIGWAIDSTMKIASLLDQVREKIKVSIITIDERIYKDYTITSISSEFIFIENKMTESKAAILKSNLVDIYSSENTNISTTIEDTTEAPYQTLEAQLSEIRNSTAS